MDPLQTMRRCFFAACVAAGLSACASGPAHENLALRYNRSAQTEAPDRNPVVVIPGLLGTNLKPADQETYTWGGFDNLFADPRSPDGLQRLSLPIGMGVEPLETLKDDNVTAGILEKAVINVAGLPIELEVYSEILRVLGAGGYRDQSLGLANAIDYGEGHYTCFQYPYDWRRDVVEAARELKHYLVDKRDYVGKRYAEEFGVEDPDVKFDIVTHSVGGLVVRYFLMYGDQNLPADGSLPVLNWAGAELVERAIFIGTPNAGSPLAFENLINGKQFSPITPEFPAALLGTYPSTYQLMPRSRHKLVIWDGDKSQPVEDIFDYALWERFDWGILDPEGNAVLAELLPDHTKEDRRAIAQAHLRRVLSRAEQFHRAIDRPSVPPAGLEMFMVLGDGLETPRYLNVDRQKGNVELGELGDGDGTVLRDSALMDERVGSDEWQRTLQSPIDFSTTLILPGEHVELTRSPVFEDNVLHWLLEDARGDN